MKQRLTKATDTPTPEQQALYDDMLRTIADVEGFNVPKKKPNPFVEDELPPTLAPKTYRQYLAEDKPNQYYIDKYNKKY